MLGVTGPNEYENNVNNNWYTNRLACWTMDWTLEIIGLMETEFPEKLKVIDVRVFRQFPGFEKIEVQALFPSGQVGASLTPAKNILEVQ